jgi:hypothetical protein
MSERGDGGRPAPGSGWGRVEELLFPKRVTVLAGHFGSGKTEIALNGALALAAAGHRVSLLDLDVVKPYFRSRSAQELLERSGIDLVAPLGEYFSSDLPIVCGDVRTHLQDLGRKVLVDAGGNDSGVRALSSVSDALPADTAFLLVLNFRRPLTPDVDSAVAMAHDIAAMARRPFTGVVSNTHLMRETTPALVREGYEMARETASRLGLPLVAVAALRTLSSDLEAASFGCPLFALDPVVKPPFEEKPEVRKVGPLFKVG